MIPEGAHTLKTMARIGKTITAHGFTTARTLKNGQLTLEK